MLHSASVVVNTKPWDGRSSYCRISMRQLIAKTNLLDIVKTYDYVPTKEIPNSVCLCIW